MGTDTLYQRTIFQKVKSPVLTVRVDMGHWYALSVDYIPEGEVSRIDCHSWYGTLIRSVSGLYFRRWSLPYWLSELILYSGKLSREKLSQILQFYGYSRKFSPQNLGVWHMLVRQKGAILKVFSTKIVFFTNSRKFSRYTVWETDMGHWGFWNITQVIQVQYTVQTMIWDTEPSEI